MAGADVLPQRVVFGAIAYGTAALLTAALWDLFLHRVPFALFFLAVVVTSHVGGWVSGLAVNVASVATTAWLLGVRGNVPELALLFAVAGLMIYFIERGASARRRLEAANHNLHAERARLHTLIQQMPAGVMIVDASSGSLTLVNRSAREILGHPIMLGVRANDYFENYALGADGRPYAPERQPLARAVLHGDVVVDEEVQYVSGSGAQVTLSLSSAPIRDRDDRIVAGLLIFTNATDRRHLEASLAQSRRLEALGRLAGGVAHDFNNLLTVIIGYCELLLVKAPGLEYPEHILRCAERAAGLTQQLLAFGRQQMLRPSIVDVHQVIDGVLPMLRRIVRAHVRLELRLRGARTTVRVDAGQLEQVIANLVMNAADAMPSGGTVTIETAVLEIDDCPPHSRFPSSRCVMLAVSDTGIGMDHDVQARIFEPFFTTKELGRGTGLGLATTYGIVTQSGGSIWVDSEKGKGTTFRVYLPVADGAPQPGVHVEASPAVGGSETILLVEDDNDVRRIASEVLRGAGYTVVDRAGAGEALAFAAESTAPIHLLLTDVVLAHASGPVLADTLHRTRPDVKVLFMSGYSDAMAARRGVLRTGDAFLIKPFTPETLRRAVRNVLDAMVS